MEQEVNVVVTRHEGLATYLVPEGIISQGTRVISHAREEDVRGKRVVGVLPLRLAALATSVTEIALDIPKEKRGEELSAQEVRQFIIGGGAVTYKVCTIAHQNDAEVRYGALRFVLGER